MTGRPTHGLSGAPEYRAWQTMRLRCTDPDHAAFIADMAGPSDRVP